LTFCIRELGLPVVSWLVAVPDSGQTAARNSFIKVLETLIRISLRLVTEKRDQEIDLVYEDKPQIAE
jgi:hypothetical protein